MAKIQIKTPEAYCIKLSKLESKSEDIANKAIYAGAKVLANKVKSGLNALPVDKFRLLKDGDKYKSVTKNEKAALIDAFGVTEMHVDEDGDYNRRVGFEDYISTSILKPTKKYPKGIPAALLVRSIESGSTIRVKHPFMRKAVSDAKGEAQKAMADVIDEEIKKSMEG